jgi:hypothetical protein
MQADYGRRWRYEMRDGTETIAAIDLADNKDALQWASALLREHGLHEATVHRLSDSGQETPIGTVRRATGA